MRRNGLQRTRNFPEAIRELQRTVALAGNTESEAWLGYVYASAGERAKALQTLHRLKELSKRQYVSPYQIAVIYTALGDKDRAFEWWDNAQRAGFDPVYLTAWPTNDNIRSDPRFAEIFGCLKERSKRGYILWVYIAGIYAGLEEKDQAFACLEKAYEQREQGLAVMKREPMFDPLRPDFRFQDLLGRMNLPVDTPSL